MYEQIALRKHAYSNILKILPPKNENFQIKIQIFVLISAQNIDCGYSLEPPRRGGSNEYSQSMFWAEIRKLMYTPVNPSFTIQKWGLRGSTLYRYVFLMERGYRLKVIFHYSDSLNLASSMKKCPILKKNMNSAKTLRDYVVRWRWIYGVCYNEANALAGILIKEYDTQAYSFEAEVLLSQI